MRNQLDKISESVSGSIGKGAGDWTIYQFNGHKQTKYPGPKIPANPRQRIQQLNRRRFLQATKAFSRLTPEQKNYYKNLAANSDKKANAFTIFVSRFLSLNTYGSSFYNEGGFSLPNPHAAIYYYGEALFNENYFLNYDTCLLYTSPSPRD